jgi:hypothetical protein
MCHLAKLNSQNARVRGNLHGNSDHIRESAGSFNIGRVRSAGTNTFRRWRFLWLLFRKLVGMTRNTRSQKILSASNFLITSLLFHQPWHLLNRKCLLLLEAPLAWD